VKAKSLRKGSVSAKAGYREDFIGRAQVVNEHRESRLPQSIFNRSIASLR